MRAILLLTTISSILVGCSESSPKTTQPSDYTHYIKPDSIIEIPVDDSTSYQSNYLTVCKINGREYLTAQNEFKNGIDIYDLDSLKLFATVKIPREGPGGISRLNGYTIINFDSIVTYTFYSLHSNAIYDKGGHFKGSLVIPNGKGLNHGTMTRSQVTANNSTLSFIVFPNKQYSFSLKQGTLTEDKIHVPALYEKAFYGGVHGFPNRTYGPDGIKVYSWGADPELHTVDMTGKHLTYPGASDHSSKLEPIPTLKLKNAEDHERQYRENDLYDVIIWDPFRRVYYRFFRQGMPMFDHLGRKNDDLLRPFYVLIFDDQLKKIGETELPPAQFFPRDWFVSRKGLFISNSNPNNASSNESIMSFTKLSLEKISK